MSAESTSVTHPDGTTIVTTTEGLVTTTVVTHPDGTKLEAKTEQAADTKPKERVLLPGSVTPSHYDVHLTPWQAGKGDQPGFTGEATVSVTVNEPTETITLHALELEIQTAAVNGTGTVEGGISYDSKLQTATLTFAEPLPVGEAKLVMSFVGVLNDKMCGFYSSTYTEGGEKKQMATTQFEACDARRAFPCWDEPALKATFSFTLTVPETMTAVSNMPVVSTEPCAAITGWKTVAFEKSCVMSTYLGAFVVAEMAFIEGATKRRGIPCRVYATSGKEKQGHFALEVCERVLDFFEEYFGLDYPLPKMDMLAIPDFAAGAMENYGCVTYRETAILWDSAKSAASAKQRVAEVVAHELAHQWFGNLTTMQWWDNLWLNEGFATFIGTMAVDHLFPEWVVWTQFVKDDWAGAMNLDGMASSHPIQVEVFSADEVSEIFDAISYYKGASVIRQVFDWIGPTAFQNGLQAYLTKFQFKNTVTNDLWAAWEKASGKPVSDVMAGWTLQTGYPLLTVAQQADGQLSFTQDRFLSDGSAGEGQWKVPIAICGDTEGSKSYSLLEAREGTAAMPSSNGVVSSWVKVNPGQTGVYRVRYSPELLAKLVPAVKALSASDRIGLVDDAFALATAGKTATTDVLNLLLAFTEEVDYTVWSKISSGLGSIKVLLAGDAEAYGYLKAFIRKLYGNVCASVGWDKKEGEAHTESLKRALVLKAMSAAEDEGTMKVAAEKFELLKADPSAPVDPDLKLLVFSLAAANGGEEAFSELVGMMRDPETMSEERVRLLQSLGSTKDEAVMAKVLGMLLDAESGVRSQDAMYCMAGVSMNLVYGRAFAWRWFKDNWDALFEKFGTGGSFTLPRLVQYATKCLVTVEDAADVEEFFSTHECEGAARTVKQAVESIRTAAASNAREGAAIVAWLKQQAEA